MRQSLIKHGVTGSLLLLLSYMYFSDVTVKMADFDTEITTLQSTVELKVIVYGLLGLIVILSITLISLHDLLEDFLIKLLDTCELSLINWTYLVVITAASGSASLFTYSELRAGWGIFFISLSLLFEFYRYLRNYIKLRQLKINAAKMEERDTIVRSEEGFTVKVWDGSYVPVTFAEIYGNRGN